MCGIAGIVHFDGRQVSQEVLDRVTDALVHRGPDARGTACIDNVGLGHRRLSIIDLSSGGSQPMHSPDGRFVLTFNGEIYNYQQLKAELEAAGHQFRSQSDTEVLLRLFEVYGIECLHRLRGMFAFAVFDRTAQQLFIARDRVGKKPVKYFVKNGTLAFASELKALRVLPECPREVDWQAVHHYLSMMYVPAPETGFTGISKLPAGHYVVFNTRTGASELRRYWELQYRTDTKRSEAEWREEVWNTLRESVRLRMISDVPVGAFLSGGVDSGAVVALMSQLTDKPVQTFSIGSDDPRYDELPDAAIVAKAFGANHHEFPLRANVVELLPQLVHTYEEPFADPASIPMYLLAQYTRSEVTVALNGDGGDENFAGYVRYPIMQFSEKWRTFPGWLHSATHAATGVLQALLKSTFSYRCERFQASIGQSFVSRALCYHSYFTDDEKQSLYRDSQRLRYPRTDSWYEARSGNSRSRAIDPIHQLMSMDTDFYLADDLLPKVDMATMAFGLESRSPLLDHKLLELTAQMPLTYKLRGLQRKWLFKQLLQGVLPEQILTRPKRGFRLPLNTWFRSDLQAFVQDRLQASDSPLWQLLDRAKLERWLQTYWDSHIDFSDQVWALLWLDEWLRQYTDTQ